MDAELSARQRDTLTTLVDTFVPSIERDDDPEGFFATKGSDVGAHFVVEQYLAHKLPAAQFAGIKALLDAAADAGLNDAPQAGREAIVAAIAGSSPEAYGGIAALRQLSIMFSFGIPDAEGRNPFWAGMGYPGPVAAPPVTPKTLSTITPTDGETLEAAQERRRQKQCTAAPSPGACPFCWPFHLSSSFCD
jgi:hypothetical protein